MQWTVSLRLEKQSTIKMNSTHTHTQTRTNQLTLESENVSVSSLAEAGSKMHESLVVRVCMHAGEAVGEEHCREDVGAILSS